MPSQLSWFGQIKFRMPFLHMIDTHLKFYWKWSADFWRAVYIEFRFVGSSQLEKVLLLYVSKSTLILVQLMIPALVLYVKSLCSHPREAGLKVLSKYRQHEVHYEVQQNMTRISVWISRNFLYRSFFDCGETEGSLAFSMLITIVPVTKSLGFMASNGLLAALKNS